MKAILIVLLFSVTCRAVSLAEFADNWLCTNSEYDYTGDNLVNFKDWAKFVVILAAGTAHSATFYMRSDGSATKDNAIGPDTDATACMSLATHNGATFAADDIIIVSDKGASSYASALIPPSSGSAGHPIAYRASGTPLFNSETTRALWINTKTNLTIDSIRFTNSSVNTFIKAIDCEGTISNITITNCLLTVPTRDSAYFVSSSGDSSNIVLDHITTSGGSTSREGIYFYGTTNGAITVSNSTLTNGKGVNIFNATSATCTNLTITNSGGFGIKLSACTGGAISNCTINTSVSDGFQILNSSKITLTNCISQNSTLKGFDINGSHGISLSNCTSTGAVDAGYWQRNGSYNVAMTDCLAQSGHSDGFGTYDTCHDITWLRCRATGNGAKTTTTEGDGFTAHLTNFNINAQYCIASGNTCTGFAMVGNTSGTISNCVAYGNGGNWSLLGGDNLDQVRGGIYFSLDGINSTTGTSWKVRNCIISQNYPVEYYVSSAGKSIVDMDYNCYWPLAADTLATIDGGTTKITWATYHATYEPHSINANPLFADTTYFILQAGSPCFNVGEPTLGPGYTTMGSWGPGIAREPIAGRSRYNYSTYLKP